MELADNDDARKNTRLPLHDVGLNKFKTTQTGNRFTL